MVVDLRGKHEADVEVIFLCVMKSNDLAGCLQCGGDN